jgi:hypothetical protein
MNIKATRSDGVDSCPEDTAELIGLYDEFRDRLYMGTLKALMAESGGSPVWLCDVAQYLVDSGFDWRDFPEWAFEAHACYRVTLRPCDVASSMWVAQVQASETISPSGAVYHTITRP